MLQIRDVVGDVRYRFRSVVHLRTGRVVALQVHAQPAAGDLGHLRSVSGIAQRLVQLDVHFAAQAARRAADYENLLPLHLSMWADTVCAPHDPLGPLVDAAGEIGPSTGRIVIRLVVPDGESPPGNLRTGVARLRAAGFGVGLDAAGTHPMAVLSDARPELLVLAAGHTTGLPATWTTRAALAGSVAFATHSGATLVADGCDTPEQAEALRAHGVHLVQGELLGPSHRRPHTQSVPAVVLDRLTRPSKSGAGEPVARKGPVPGQATTAAPVAAAELAHPAATMPSDATGDAARMLFADRPELTGVVLVDGKQRPLACLDRDRFMLAITGPFGYSLHARRLAAELGDPPRTLGPRATLAEAIEMVAGAPTARMSDDIVIVDHIGRCQGVLRIGDLVRDLAQRQSARRAPAAGFTAKDPTAPTAPLTAI